LFQVLDIAEEAKPVCYPSTNNLPRTRRANEKSIVHPKILSLLDHPFSLVESRDCPSDGKNIKTKLSDNDAFETAFVGSSEQDCEDWFFGKQNVINYMEFNIIGIADARTAKDGTISMRWYQDGEGVERPPYGVLPPKPDSWYEFRTEPEGAARLLADLWSQM
jgi:hypothetical protein